MTARPRGVVVIGAGIGGLAAARILQQREDVTLFEAQDRLGGHAHTHRIHTAVGETIVLDSGFIVYNQAGYPQLTRLFQELGIVSRPSEMSFSVTCDGCGLQYVAGSPVRALPERQPHIPARTWQGLLEELDRFNMAARACLESDSDITLDEQLALHRHSDFFVQHMVLPLVSAVWSCGPRSAGRYPARYLFKFLANHGLLRGLAATRWRTVVGGSATYVDAIVRNLSEVRTGTPVVAVKRLSGGGVEVVTGDGVSRVFAAAVIATHPLQALKLRDDATADEQEILSAFPYVASTAVLHSDSKALPAASDKRASWNIRQRTCAAADHDVEVSYYLNRLQNIDGDSDYVVTLNPMSSIDPAAILATMEYEHPLYTRESLTAQHRLPSISRDGIAYAGAYHGWGFHEDGCRSGVAAARALGQPW